MNSKAPVIIEDVAFEENERELYEHEHTTWRDVIRLARRIWPYVKPELRALIIFGLIALTIGMPIFIVLMKLVPLFVDVLAYGNPIDADSAWLIRVPIDADYETILIHACVAFSVFIITIMLIVMPMSIFMIKLIQRITNSFRTSLYDRFHDLSLSFHGDQKIGDAIYRLFMDSSTISFVLRAIVITPVRVFTIGLIMIVFMTAIHPKLSLIYWALIPFQLMLAYFFARPIRVAFRHAREANSKMMTRIEESLTSLRAARMFGRELDERRNYERASWTAFSETLRARMTLSAYRVVNFAIVGIGLIAFGYFGAFEVWGEYTFAPELAELLKSTTFTVGIYLVVRQIFRLATKQVHSIVSMWGMLQDTTIALDRVFEMLDTVPAIEDRENPVEFPEFTSELAPSAHGASATNGKPEIKFDNVSYAYTPDVPVLTDISFTAKEGTVTALVGTTGAGKTTLVNLLPRFFDVTEGNTSVNGVDIRDIRLRSLRDNISIALQENILFSATVAENIEYGMPDASEEQIREAAQIACADDFIEELPHQYETFLGQKAAKLSTGQRQRIGIARAVIRNTPILILDEPTASLDAETEMNLVKNLRDWGHDKTIFLIAHRLSTVKHADQILFLNDGRLLERGTHEELMAIEGGQYREFAEAQSLNVGDLNIDKTKQAD